MWVPQHAGYQYGPAPPLPPHMTGHMNASHYSAQVPLPPHHLPAHVAHHHTYSVSQQSHLTSHVHPPTSQPYAPLPAFPPVQAQTAAGPQAKADGSGATTSCSLHEGAGDAPSIAVPVSLLHLLREQTQRAINILDDPGNAACMPAGDGWRNKRCQRKRGPRAVSHPKEQVKALLYDIIEHCKRDFREVPTTIPSASPVVAGPPQTPHETSTSNIIINTCSTGTSSLTANPDPSIDSLRKRFEAEIEDLKAQLANAKTSERAAKAAKETPAQSPCRVNPQSSPAAQPVTPQAPVASAGLPTARSLRFGDNEGGENVSKTYFPEGHYARQRSDDGSDIAAHLARVEALATALGENDHGYRPFGNDKTMQSPGREMSPGRGLSNFWTLNSSQASPLSTGIWAPLGRDDSEDSSSLRRISSAPVHALETSLKDIKPLSLRNTNESESNLAKGAHGSAMCKPFSKQLPPRSPSLVRSNSRRMSLPPGFEKVDEEKSENEDSNIAHGPAFVSPLPHVQSPCWQSPDKGVCCSC
mmetsp:Transcript_8931/g.32894  ORF Transcript_8931/g.32894 Transcript_8931/m.32894 type:complete len:528 (-) Transcript_8931:373-1956(-)